MISSKSILLTLTALLFSTAALATQTPSAPTVSANPPPSLVASKDEKLNINLASVKELTRVKGLTAAKAKAIVGYRKKHDGFKSLEELKSIQGFKRLKEATLNKIQLQLTV